MKSYFLPLFFAAVIVSTKQSYAAYQYLSPVPGSKMVSVEHNIIIRPGMLLDAPGVIAGLFSIHGTKSGNHEFELVISADNKTVILTPTTPFAYSEEVTVVVTEGIHAGNGSAISGTTFSFQTQRLYSETEKEQFKSARNILLNEELKKWNIEEENDGDTRDVGGLVEITVNTNPSPGDIFFDSFSGYGIPSKYTGYSVITTDGDSLFNKETGFSDDFKLLHNGLFGVYNGTYGRFDVLDSSFNLIDKIYPANGYGMDNHELQMTADGHAFIIAQEFQIIDLTVYDTIYNSAATIFATVIQEFDEKENLVFEWRALDHVEIPEALHENLTFGYIDYMHTNALEIDNDGNILASHRHLDQITKIDRNTGEFIWRLGGVKNEFTFLNGSPAFSYQHDIRRIANGNITLFDNGNWNPVAYTTAKEYHLDEVNKTAELAWSYSHPADWGGFIFYFAMGSVQRLANGNTFINWGWRGPVSTPSMTEVTPDGEIVWELKLLSAKNMVAYRGHKYEYDPCVRPTFKLMNTAKITSNSALLKWRPAFNASEYKIQYTENGSANWKEKIVNASKTSQALANLSPSTTYLWKLQTLCDDAGTSTSAFTETRKFETLPLKSMDAVDGNDVLLYPNPASEYLLIESSLYDIHQIRLVNMVGQVLVTKNLSSEANNESIQLSLEGITPGNYFLELIGTDQRQVKKFIVE